MTALRFTIAFLFICSVYLCKTLACQGTGCNQTTNLVGPQQFCFNLQCPDQAPRTCKDVTSNDARAVAVLSDGLEVLCDTQTDGGGWLVIQRRVNGQLDFYRNWEDYKYGFGDLNGEFWYGLEKVHRLTQQRRYELRIDLKFNNNDFFATYSQFRLFGEPENYKLEATGYSGTAGDSLAVQNNMRFSTKDRDNDAWNNACAVSYHGAWWYNKCHYSNLNGLWGSVNYAEGLTWYATTGYHDSATFSEMKIRPVN